MLDAIVIDDFLNGIGNYVTEPVSVRKLSAMAQMYLEGQAALTHGDPVLYRSWSVEPAPGVDKELAFGLTFLNPGLIGKEYFMTAGHFHRGNGAEVHVIYEGRGLLLMRTRDGEVATKRLEPGTIAYLPSGWAHRTVNVGGEVLKFLCVWPTGLAHDYETIRREGFGCRVIAGLNGPELITAGGYRLRE